ncbi:neprilysin-like isoform X2 [Tubulanus polymorphus]|uniref:neprilysin-like isoform X2 n=1 Tax=Tubulanus polymorphus TaxID=672921 RepID=UPI003DA2A33E
MGDYKQDYVMVNCNDGKFKENSHVGISGQSKKRRWLNRRTKLELCLLIVCFILILLAVILIILYAVNISSQGKNEVCYSADCVKTAARVMNGMDSTVNPCDDFFQYACGQWNKKNSIPSDASSINTFSKLRDELQVILNELLAEPITTDEPESVIKAKQYYKSCMNETEIERRDLQPLRAFIVELGGWPVLDANWDVNKFTVLDLTLKLKMLSNSVLVHSAASSDDRNSSARMIIVDQPILGMPGRDYYLKGRQDKTLKAYEQYALDFALALGADKAYAEQEIASMIDFEIKLANVTMPEEKRRDSEALYHKTTVGELAQNFSQWDWMTYFNRMFNVVNHTINASEPVVVYAPEYLEQALPVIFSTSNRTVANYLVWRILKNRVNNLPSKYRDIKNRYDKVLYGTGTERPRFRTCVDYTKEYLGMAVGRIFVQKHFKHGAKADAEAMIANIRQAFNDLLLSVEWMDADTKKVAKEKADAIQYKIGYPEAIMNDTALNEFYKMLNYDENKYFENVLVNLREFVLSSLKKLRDPVDKNKWSTTPAVVNAFYSSSRNQIMFPAGILQPPFYSQTYPKSMNYGGIGMVIGHEITHGFDDEGRQFDKNGNLQQWWTESAIGNFKTRAQCIIDQYSNYTVPSINMNLNGIQTQGENIADNGGLKQAYQAYRDWVKTARNGIEESRLPGLEHLTNDQLFFLNFAQVWCGTLRDEAYINRISTGRHSPGEFRVIGSVSNTKEFSEAYSCPSGSPMNPVHKCQVW